MRNPIRVLHLCLVTALLVLSGGCASDHDGYTPFWLEAGMRTPSTGLRQIVLRGDGSFIDIGTSAEGRLEEQRHSRLRVLFTEERITTYRDDVVGNDGNLPDATEQAPLFSVRVRAEAGKYEDGRPRFGGERLDGYFAESASTRAATREMLVELTALFRDSR